MAAKNVGGGGGERREGFTSEYVNQIKHLRTFESTHRLLGISADDPDQESWNFCEL